MVAIQRFRSTWGVPPGDNYKAWEEWFPRLKAQGYAGVEIDIGCLSDLHLVRQLCERTGLQIIPLIQSEWVGYAGPKPATLGPVDHLRQYRRQLERAKTLNPVKINVHSGFDSWSLDDSVEFFAGSLTVDAELGLEGKVCHETHRVRALYNPFVTAEVVRRVPGLRINADFSHFVVVCESLFAAEEDYNYLRTIIPHVHHIHCRVGTTESSQCPDPTNPFFANERRFLEEVWKEIIEARSGSGSITFVPEYGPYPYHPFGSSRDFSEVADFEGTRLQSLFEEFAGRRS
ncbi:hypothetical protein DL546_009416 [Coniochaeta pulveracea]|uniref:Uncharacterized protein n=1 Tax=Coniochaeta pulveracea TaxID=177199 RepID=A0A420YJ82_9PEZI|nr:hypothetical protein DL546_009416 [Coniochaeta pulveracea]